ncbi:MAG: radical SAM protein [Candidatus Saganbacteria bacterium]|nr:radical SAM protein [Candidatus Saganbacteria bacterium]
MLPKICQFYLTLRCNATCEFCDFWSESKYQEDDKYKEAPTDKILSVLEELKDRGVEELRITGGEPLLYDNLPHVLGKARQLDLKTILITNCILYAERSKEIQGMVDQLFFSLDYPYPEKHNRSRGRSVFNKLIRSIEAATHLKEDPAILYTVTRDSILYLPETIEFCEKFNINLFLNPVYDFSGTQGFNPDSVAYLKYYGRRKNVFVNLAMLEFIKNRGNNLAWPRCRASQNVVTLLPSGQTVSPCFFNQEGRQGKNVACSSCMRWPYMVPSFSSGFDKYRFFDWYSKYIWKQRKKPAAVRKGS